MMLLVAGGAMLTARTSFVSASSRSAATREGVTDHPAPRRFICVDPAVGSDENTAIRVRLAAAQAAPMRTLSAAVARARADRANPLAIVLKGNAPAAPVLYDDWFNVLAVDARPAAAPC